MSVGGGHPGEVVKFKVLSAGFNSVLLGISKEDSAYFADKVDKDGIADFRFPGDEPDSGPKAASAG